MEYNKPELQIIISETVFTELTSIGAGEGEELQGENQFP